MRKKLIAAVLAGCAAGLLFAVFLFVRASLPGTRPEDRKGPVLKVIIVRDGTVTADGAPVTLAQLEPLLQRIKSVDGTVWFHREHGSGRPPSEMLRVIKFIIERGVPISLSSRPDFSDYIDKQGLSRPRKKR